MKTTIVILALALVVATSASASTGVIFSKRAASYETHVLLAQPKMISAHCALQTRRKLVCRFRFVHAGRTFTADGILVPLTLHSYRQTICIDEKCESSLRKTPNHSHMIIRA